MASRRVGTVRELRRYPVKSMAAEALGSVAASWHGLAGDRRWAFIRPGVERSGFPWLTIREKPDLWRYEPRFEDAENVESSRTVVRTPEGEEFEVADPEFARRLGEGVRVMKQYSGVFDTFPLSVLTVQSVESLSGLVGQELSWMRFRPNILVDAAEAVAGGAGGFPEDEWCGGILRVGALRCRLDKRDQRCVMVNVDPAKPGSSQKDVLRAIAQQRGAQFGMYATTVEPGTVAVGDPVYWEG